MRRPLRWLLRAGLGLTIVLGIAVVAAWLLLHGSLPRLEGSAVLPSLAAPVLIERDGDGIATITAEQRTDLARALGYLHAQERFFEMDLARRSAAGELAALFGEAALPVDKRHRVHRFRARAERWWPTFAGDERAQLQAYTDGVNAGLADLNVRPWPYLLLRQPPAPWRAEDSLLVVLAMFFDLQDGENRRERQLDIARRHLPPAVLDFIARAGSEWDAPLIGVAMPDPPLPSAAEIDLRSLPPVPRNDDDDALQAESDLPGSNSFAVAGQLTAHGRALVANDMHLGLRVPNIWFRTRLIHGEGDGRVSVDGVTLPGVPAVVVGSNGWIAWAFTNSYGDWLDLVRLDIDPHAPERYRTADGWRTFDTVEERIAIAGGESETVAILETSWGPVIGEDADGAPMALAWTAHHAGAVNAELVRLERARNVEAALAIAAHAGIPAQNFIVGDRNGRIAWTIAGRIPQRRGGYDPARPVASSALPDGDLWLGWLDPAAYPRVVDPESGRLWTANARLVNGDGLALLGDGGYDNGARAGQIRDGLFARSRFDENELLAIQLDDRALFIERWWRLLRETLDSAPGDDTALNELSAATAIWNGCACVDSVSYRLARAFRTHVHDALMRGLSAPVRAHVERFAWPKLPQNEGVVWQLLRERPAHLLPPPHETWEALLVTQARRVVNALSDTPGGLSARTWGEANTAHVRHPLAAALPAFIGAWLDMPPQPLPGDNHMPRVQGTRFGASQRMTVAPGLETQGIMHMPGGQSGHPLSPYYGTGHDAWVHGKSAPLAPAATRWHLHLLPIDTNDPR